MKTKEFLITVTGDDEHCFYDDLSDLDFGGYLIDYYKPTPTRESILEELGYIKGRMMPPNVPYSLLGAVQEIENLPPEKIKTLFNIKD